MEGSGLVGAVLLLHEDDIHRPGEGGGVDVPEVGDQPMQEVHGVQASLQQLSVHYCCCSAYLQHDLCLHHHKQ